MDATGSAPAPDLGLTASAPPGSTPGLTWYARPRGRREPRWVASREARALGFTPATVNLTAFAADPVGLAQRCRFLQGQMLHWLAVQGERRRVFDGSVASLLDIYETHEDSPYRGLKRASGVLYASYLARLRAAVGKRSIAGLTGIDVKRWQANFAAADKPSAPPKLATAHMHVAVFKAALSFGHALKLAGCAELRVAIQNLRLPGPRPRELRPLAAEIVAVRRAAHAAGRPSLALACALQFETAARQYDVVGEWVPLADPGLSDVATADEKWVGGLRWDMVDADGILRFVPGKTSRTTGKRVEVDLALCPMVIEEIGGLSAKRRTGPMIVEERTGRPWRLKAFRAAFRTVATAAGWPAELWSRDIRAGGLSEARDGGAHLTDAARLAGHASERTTARVYDRAVLEATRRASAARVAVRGKSA